MAPPFLKKLTNGKFIFELEFPYNDVVKILNLGSALPRTSKMKYQANAGARLLLI